MAGNSVDHVEAMRVSASFFYESYLHDEKSRRHRSESRQMSMPTLFYNFWSVAIALGTDGDDFAQVVSDRIVQYDRQGTLERLMKKWSVPPPEFTRRMRAVWSRKNASPHSPSIDAESEQVGHFIAQIELHPQMFADLIGQIDAEALGLAGSIE
jgi:hypothetical protein